MRKGYEDNTFQAVGGTMTGTLEAVYDKNVELVRAAQEGDEDAKAELVNINTGLVRSIALRFRERGVEFDDLVQIGTVGLLKAIKSFDVERGTCFSTYAFPLIIGEIRRHLRDEGPIKIGRQYKKLGAELLHAKNRIIAEEGRDPRISELAELCGTTREEAAIALEATSPMASLSDSVFGEDDDTEMIDTVADEESLSETERLFDRIALGQAISRMSEDWKKIVILRYYRNQTQQQIADTLGVTQVKVSREEKKIIEFLRGQLVR